MPSRTWLFLDMSYLCHRAFHSFKGIRFDDIGRHVPFGVIREISTLQREHVTPHIAFCFDRGPFLREQAYPAYKLKRKEKYEKKTCLERELSDELRRQIKRLRRKWLPELGYVNVFSQLGYEGDDIIAVLCGQLPKKDRAIIVASDHDLFQCISDRISVWNPTTKKLLTRAAFVRTWGLGPSQWADVKAIAGCDSDGVTGVDGVGEKTACKFIAGTLKQESVAFKKIAAGNKIWRQNKALVTLPYPGCGPFELIADGDTVTVESWEAVADQIGVEGLQEIIPPTVRRAKVKRTR